jgi:hypothetical protein
MKKSDDLLRKLQVLEAARRLSLERGETRVRPEDSPARNTRREDLQRVFESKITRQDN